jgi:hypothetical protein
MTSKILGAAALALPVIAGGLVYAGNQKASEPASQVASEGYICPATGEELPCPNCCPLKNAK